MPEPKLPAFDGFRRYVAKELYGSEHAAKILRWAEQMQEWAEARLEDHKQAKARIDQLQAQISTLDEEIAHMNNYEDVATMAADVRRGIRTLDELWEILE
jgi:TolA-binding protein